MAQSFDAKGLELAGDMFPLAERISPGANLNYALVSASDDGMLVFQPGRTVSTHLAWFDRSGKQAGSVVALATGIAMALSPDEKAVAISRISDSQGTTSDIWLHETGVRARDSGAALRGTGCAVV